jgi:hypothetical protein
MVYTVLCTVALTFGEDTVHDWRCGFVFLLAENWQKDASMVLLR